MAMCCQSNSAFLFLLFWLCDVGCVAVTDSFKLKVFLHLQVNKYPMSND